MEVTKLPAFEFPKTSEARPVVPTEPIAAEENKKDPTEQVLTKQAIIDKVESLNDFLEPTSTNVKFQLHEQLDVYYVQVIDAQTEEVLREIPNKKFLDMYASMADLTGLIVDEKL